MQLRATNYRIDQVEKTPSGSLRVRGKLTKSGVFEYQRGDSVVRERCGDAEVFDPKSLDTLRGAHVTLDHPMDFVDSENWKLHSIGTVISAEADPPYVVGELVVHDISSAGGAWGWDIPGARGVSGRAACVLGQAWGQADTGEG